MKLRPALRHLTLTLGAACAVVALAGPAGAGVVTQPGGAAVRAHGLTVAERRAITITSVSTTGDDSLGVIVRATFQGNIERYLGQGHLTDGLLALVLVPGTGGQSPTGLVDQGGGFAPVRIPVVERHGNHLRVVSTNVDVFGSERVSRRPASRQAVVVRHDNQVLFYLAGPGLSQVAKIELEVFATSPAGPGSPAGVSQKRGRVAWRQILAHKATELASLNVDPSKLACDQLAPLGSDLAGTAATALASDLRRQTQARRALNAAIAQYREIGHLVRRAAGAPKSSKDQLTRDVGETTARIAQLRGEAAGVDHVIGLVDALIKACAPPPPPPSTTTTQTTPKPPPPPVSVVQTDPGLSQQMAPQPGLAFSSAPPAGAPVIDVNEQVRYQRFSGLGGAMTDSAAWLIYDQLSSADRTTLMQDLFGSAGIHLNFLRVAMGASGAMTNGPAYSYDDMPSGQSDPSLAHFSIGHDLPYIIPTLQQALSINPGLRVLANPWSPPGWMKGNDSLDNKNDQGTLLTADYQPLANYFVKVIQEYANQGVPIDAITPQNEPRTSGSGTAYPGLTLPEPDEAQFISQNLAPALSAAGLHTKIYGNDLSWDSTSYANGLASGPAAGDLSGIAWHCYFGSPTVMSQFQQTAPALDQIVDECSPEIRGFGTPEFLISSLRNFASAVAVWGLALDPGGGPIQTGNNCGGCRGLVTIDEQTHSVTIRPEYYQLGQVSSVVQPGAQRIDSQNFVSYGVNGSNIETVTAGLDDVAFLNPDGSKVLVAYNNSTAPISFGVQTDGRYFTYTIPAQAMTTFIWH